MGGRDRVTRWAVPIGLGLGVAVLLAAAVSLDPARGVTASASPFADEGFNTVNARNLVLLGRWSTDGWNLHLVDLPLSALLAAVFRLFGVGIVQARLACIALVGLLVTLLAAGLRRPFGAWPAALAALAVATSGLVLYYGRLVYQEDLVVLCLAAGVLTLGRFERDAAFRWGLLGGLGLALAIGTKPSAAFAVAGILIALALAGRRARATWRWLGGAVLVIALAGLGWALLIGLPDRSQVEAVLRIWPPFTWPTTPGAALRRVVGYATGNDGAVRLCLALVIAGAAGAVVVIAGRARLEPAGGRLVAAAVGWLGGGLGILALASYRPNRYVLPMLPAAAILAAAGLWLAAPWLRGRLPGARRVVAAGLVATLVAAPGLLAYASWVRDTPSTLPAIQDRMARLVPSGVVVAGADSALFLMRAPVVTTITREGISGNSGDLYDSAGVRWYLTNRDVAPYAVTLPPGAWAARRLAGCERWFDATDCLYEVP